MIFGIFGVLAAETWLSLCVSYNCLSTEYRLLSSSFPKMDLYAFVPFPMERSKSTSMIGRSAFDSCSFFSEQPLTTLLPIAMYTRRATIHRPQEMIFFFIQDLFPNDRE